MPERGHGGSPPGRDRAPRVLLVCDALFKYTAALAAGLAEAGAEVKLLGRDHALEFGGDQAEMKRYAEGVLGGRVDHIVLSGRVREPRHWQRAVAIGRHIRRWEPDVVHYQAGSMNDPVLLLAAPPPRGRTALTVHDPVEHAEEPDASWQTFGEDLLLRRSKLVFIHAEALREQLRETGRPNAAIVVVPHGVATPTVRPLPPQPTLLAFGRIHPYKGLDVLFDAMPGVWAELPEARLRVVGQGHLPEHPSLADPRVEVSNAYLPEADVPDVFADSTCVVLSYREASQSGVGSLAKEHGRAIVASRTGGLPELVGDAGRIVPPADPEALAAALVEVLATPGLAAELGRRAAASIAGTASWNDVGARTLDAYTAVLGAPPRPLPPGEPPPAASDSSAS